MIAMSAIREACEATGMRFNPLEAAKVAAAMCAAGCSDITTESTPWCDLTLIGRHTSGATIGIRIFEALLEVVVVTPWLNTNLVFWPDTINPPIIRSCIIAAGETHP